MTLLGAIVLMLDQWLVCDSVRATKTHWPRDWFTFREDMGALAEDIHPGGAQRASVNKAAEIIMVCRGAVPEAWISTCRHVWYEFDLNKPIEERSIDAVARAAEDIQGVWMAEGVGK